VSHRKITNDEPPSKVVDIDEHWRPAVKNWGLSNWESTEAFASPTHRSMSAWAWEFLRRCPNYRLTWQEIAGPRLAPDGSEIAAPTDGANEAAVFGLPRLLDPRRPNACPRFGSHRDDRSPILGPCEHQLRLRANEAAITVDLSRPLGPQLAGAVVKMKGHALASRRARVRVDQFPKLLRVLDAIELKTPTAKIGRILAADVRDPKDRPTYIRRWREQAEQLRDHGYLWIAAQDK
jgi:hypothetical protein